MSATGMTRFMTRCYGTTIITMSTSILMLIALFVQDRQRGAPLRDPCRQLVNHPRGHVRRLRNLRPDRARRSRDRQPRAHRFIAPRRDGNGRQASNSVVI
ncbi:hypothetical protein NBRC116589_05420 [Ruegeria sp. HU-ET01832]